MFLAKIKKKYGILCVTTGRKTDRKGGIFELNPQLMYLYKVMEAAKATHTH